MQRLSPSPSPLSLPRSARLALLTALLLLAGVYLAHLARMPHWDWNAVRVLPSVAMTKGYDLYYGADSGPVMSTLYGPVKALLYLPAAVASTPTGAMAIAGTLNILVVLLPLALILRDRDRWRWSAGFALAAGTLLLWRATRYMATKIHVDAPAVGLGLLACWVLIDPSRREPDGPPSDRRLAVAALLTVLAAWTKQVQAPLAFALLAFVGLAWGRGVAGRLFARLAVAGIVVSGVFLLVFDARAMVFNILTIPAAHPYLGKAGWGVVGWWGLATMELLIKSSPFLLILLLALRARPAESTAERFRACPWLVFVLAAAATWPTSVLGRTIIGGDENSSHALAYVMVAALWLVARGEFLAERPGLGDGVLVVGAVVVVLAAAWQVGRPAELLAWRSNPQEEAYRYALAHPGEAYFPWNPLSTLLAEGRLDHFDYNVYDRELAGFPLSEKHFRAHLPPSPRVVFFHDDAHDQRVMRYLPSFSVETRLPEMPGWTAFVIQQD